MATTTKVPNGGSTVLLYRGGIATRTPEHAIPATVVGTQHHTATDRVFLDLEANGRVVRDVPHIADWKADGSAPSQLCWDYLGS